MKQWIWQLTNPTVTADGHEFSVPRIKHFAIRSPLSVEVNGQTNYEGIDFRLEWADEKLVWTGDFPLDSGDTIALRVPFEEFIDTAEAAFHWMSDPARKAAVAHCFDELDRCLRAESWMASCLMAGAVLEGILADQQNDNASTFADLISNSTVLSAQQKAVAGELKEARNRTHAGRVARQSLAMPTKELALRSSTMLDRLLQELP